MMFLYSEMFCYVFLGRARSGLAIFGIVWKLPNVKPAVNIFDFFFFLISFFFNETTSKNGQSHPNVYKVYICTVYI